VAQPWGRHERALNAESVGQPARVVNAFSVEIKLLLSPRVVASSNPGLKLANAFGVQTDIKSFSAKLDTTMDKQRAKRISKYLSLVLRHEPSAAGVTLDPEGWVDVDDLLDGAARYGFSFTIDELEQVVRTNDKQRFALSADAKRIRANQGHSVVVDLGLTPQTPPTVLYHGTVEEFVTSIMANGLEKRSRQHVHLSPDIATATRVGSRRGKAIILEIAAVEMHYAGYEFFRSANGVWLTEEVPTKYVSKLADNTNT
jgi:putative RNA 2'-phosphotransferase